MLHYLDLPDRERAHELVKALEGQGREVHTYPDGVGALWFVRVKDASVAPAHDERRSELARLAERYGGDTTARKPSARRTPSREAPRERGRTVQECCGLSTATNARRHGLLVFLWR